MGRVLRLRRLHRFGWAALVEELLGSFVQADQRSLRIEGTLVDIQHVFHGAHKRGVGFGRNAPALLQPGLEFVFLSVWRTVSWLTASTYPCWISRSASRCSVQRFCPLGGALQTVAMRKASAAPSSTRALRLACSR